MADRASFDQNQVPTLIAVSTADNATPVTLQADPDTHALVVSGGGGGGGGTEYTEDAVAAANPTGTVPILVRADTPATITSADGDNVAQRGTDYGAAYVTLLDSGGAPVSVGGGTQYTEDAAAAANPIGTMQMAVRVDALTSEVSADGDNIALRATGKGELYIKSADPMTVVQVTPSDLNTAIHGWDGSANRAIATTAAGVVKIDDNGAAISIDDNGATISIDDGGGSITVDGTVTVTAGVGATDLGKAEDSAHANADTGIMMLAVRKDSAAALAGADGDYAPLEVDASGRLHTVVQSVTPGTSAANLGKAVDSAAGATDTGVALLGVRDDALTTLTPVDGDYTPARLNARGAAWIAIEDGAGGQVTSFGGGTQYTEDAAAAADPVGNMNMAVRADTLGAVTSTDGDNIAVRATNKGEIYVKQTDAVPVTDNSGSLTVDDGGSSLTVNGAVTVSGTATVSGTVTANAGSGFPSVQTEDGASAGGETGLMLLAVRNDSASAKTSTDGDFSAIAVDSAGRVGITDLGGAISIDDNGSSITVDGTVSITANSSVNVNQIGGNAVNAGTGAAGTGTQRVVTATDSTIGTVTSVTQNADVRQSTASNLNAQVVGTIAHDSADSGNPVKVGFKAKSSLAGVTLVAADDRADAYGDLDGAMIVRTGFPLGDLKSDAISNTDGASTASSVFTAVASTKNYVTAVHVFRTDSGTTPIYIDFRDGTGGSVLYRAVLPPNGGAVLPSSPTPYFKTSANTALAYDVSAATTTVYINVSGFQSKL